MPGWNAMINRRQSGGPPNAFGAKNDRVRRPSHTLPFRRSDMVSRHLLVETALLDSQNFELLAIEEVDALKKEKAQLESRLEATRRKLALESKVRDAAQSLHRLYTDDPTAGGSPTSPKKRLSFLGDKTKANGGMHVGQAGDELATSQKKIDDLLQILSGMESRRQYVESRLLRHTAAVLQLDHEEQAQARANDVSPVADLDDFDRNLVDSTISGFLNGGGYEESIYSKHMSRGSANLSGFGLSMQQPTFDKMSNEKLMSLQSRVDGMNSQMRNLIQLVRGDKFTRDDESETKGHLRTGEDAVAYLETQVELVDKNLIRLEQECIKARDERESTESHLVETSKQLHSLLQSSNPSGITFDLPEPPQSSVNDATILLNYLDEAMLTLQSTLQNQGQQASRETEEARERADQYETTVEGLWDILNSTNTDKEPFSLQAFSTRVQHAFEKVANMDVQLDILRRQIQQQRELNSKSDSEKDRQLSEVQAVRSELEQELLELRDRHVAAEAETQGTRAEMDNIMKEVEQFRVTAKANEEQKQTVLEQLARQNSRAQELEAMLTNHQMQISELEDDARLASAEAEARSTDHESRVQGLVRELAEARDAHVTTRAKLNEKHKESEDMEVEVVRLTTELTMVKAELDAAYGSRAERAKEINTANTAELEGLRRERDAQAEQLKGMSAEVQRLTGGENRAAMLERELQDMAKDLQDLVRESVAAEKEREQLETLLDGLRERCETLETQLSDEKVRTLGVASPTVVNGETGREPTSAMVLRNEFKKMMRETRAEHAKVLRAEQEERKKLESIIRSLKKDNGTLKGAGGK
ncbi:hypothetical protein K461DRAFT_266939 [Myriangium duriaei CBS 260.36]|uniref:Up-regulated during septation protein 1 domain-containing protein n=1 Tax=Myriangium duriaei CBS 260.36 TaxID=1168546 RepID=A0A9P4J7L5_9PEZI|nr:hypothetical protein K461DRAFT_266939 [Myriangium duriaei CBS 260.36]